MSVERAQRLVMSRCQKTGLYHLIEKPSFRNQMNYSNNSNYLCLVCSLTDNMLSVGPIYRLIDYLMQHIGFGLFAKFMYFLYEHGFILIPYIYANILVAILAMLFYPWIFGLYITTLNPFQIFYTLTLGGYYLNPTMYEYQYHPSSGWVATFGLNGTRIFHDQPLWGNLPLPSIKTPLEIENDFYPGIFGFTGIQIFLGAGMFHLGSALWVEIGSEHP